MRLTFSGYESLSGSSSLGPLSRSLPGFMGLEWFS